MLKRQRNDPCRVTAGIAHVSVNPRPEIPPECPFEAYCSTA